MKDGRPFVTLPWHHGKALNLAQSLFVISEIAIVRHWCHGSLGHPTRCLDDLTSKLCHLGVLSKRLGQRVNIEAQLCIDLTYTPGHGSHCEYIGCKQQSHTHA